MSRPTLVLQSVYLHDSDRDDARRLGDDLYNLLTRPIDDRLAYGAGIPVLSAVAPERVDTEAADIVVIAPVLGKTAFQTSHESIIETLNGWHEKLGAGHVIPAPLAKLWRSVETELLGKPLLTSLYGEGDGRRETLDEIVLAVTRLLEPEWSPVRLFISHAKADLASTGEAAKAIHRHVVENTTGKAFFDATDLRPGEDLAEQIGEEVSRGVLIAVRGDAYSSRDWCQRELLRAKRLGLPTLSVDILKTGEQRVAPYAGNGPCLVWDQANPGNVASRAMVEWLRAAHFHREAERLCSAAQLPPQTRYVTRPPELLDLAQGPLESSGAQLVLHPDPELPIQEREILHAAHPRLRVATPTTVFRRLLSHQGSANVAAPLEGLQVAMSLSNSPGVDGREGYTKHHVDDAIVFLARSLISAGAAIAYGGDFRITGYTELLGELIASYNETAARQGDFLHSYPAAHFSLDDAPDLAIKIHHLGACKDAIVPPPEGEELAHHPAIYLGDMRRVMARHTHARILLGGMATPRVEEGGEGYSGRFPGVVEEAWRTLEAGQPLYAMGGFGGAAALVAQLMDEPNGEPPEALRDQTWLKYTYFAGTAASVDGDEFRDKLQLPHSMEAIAEAVRGMARERLASDKAAIAWNGLNLEQNRQLRRTRDPMLLTSLVVRGLLQVSRQSGHGKLEIELVNGSVTSANQLDAIALATFSNVPLGGAGAALDQAVGGRAALGHREGQALIPLTDSEIDAHWLYLASLGSMAELDDLDERIERAARDSAGQALRHGFGRQGVVTFGGAVCDPAAAAAAMLRGFADLAGEATSLVWFETNDERFEKLRETLANQSNVKLSTRRIATEPHRQPVVSEPLLLQVTRPDEHSLAVAVMPPAGTGIAKSHTPSLSETELEQYSRGIGLEGRTTPPDDSLTARGAKLTQLLLGDGGQQILDHCKASRVVVLHDVASSRLPFEVLGVGDNRPAATCGLSRRLMVADAETDRLFGRPPRSGRLEVALIVNPTGDLAASVGEAHAVQSALDSHNQRVRVATLKGPEATKSAVRQALENADILHYCGHAFYNGPGDEESGLVLAGDEFLTVRELRDLSAAPRVVFFNACEAGRVRGAPVKDENDVAAFAELILSCGVEAFVGTYWRVEDEAAKTFATALYARLAEGDSIESAVYTARRVLRDKGDRDWANYMLYGDGRFQLLAGGD